MQQIKKLCSVLLFTLCFLALSPLSNAAPREVKLPPETATLPESELPGYRLAVQKCTVCHSVDYIHYQPPEMSKVQWTAEVAKMKHAYGARLTETDINSIGAYLAEVYGKEKPE